MIRFGAHGSTATGSVSEALWAQNLGGGAVVALAVRSWWSCGARPVSAYLAIPVNGPSV